MGRLKYWDDIANEWVEVTVPHHSHSVTSLSTSASEGQIFVSDGNGHVVAADNVGGSWQQDTFSGDKMIYPADDLDGVALNDLQLYYRNPGDLNHSMGWGYVRHNIDGPVLNGFVGGGFAVGDANDDEDMVVGGWDEDGLISNGEHVSVESHGHTVGDITGLATIATSGAYSDLTGAPTIPSVASVPFRYIWDGTAYVAANGGVPVAGQPREFYDTGGNDPNLEGFTLVALKDEWVELS